MRARFLATGAAVWTAAIAGIYLLVISAQGNTPAWWYLAVLGASVLLFALAAGRLWRVPLLITGAILLTGAALAGVLSIGMLLVPGVLAAVAALGPTRRPRPGHPRPECPPADGGSETTGQAGARLAPPFGRPFNRLPACKFGTTLAARCGFAQPRRCAAQSGGAGPYVHALTCGVPVPLGCG